MTVKLYDKDSYIKKFEAEVLSCEKNEKGYEIILDKTAFFPEEGGQCSDKGFLNDAEVYDAFLKDGVIYHLTDKPLLKGETVTGEINWNIRYRNMQNHSGEHILSGLAHSMFGLENVGFHLGADEVTMDISGVLTDEQVSLLELKANEVILENKEIICRYPDEKELSEINYRSKLDLSENVRIVNIKDVDFCACCAPHVKSTAEVGIIKISSKMNWKGGMRFFIKCGFDGYREYCSLKENASMISALLSAKQESIFESVQKLKSETDELKIKNAELEKRLALIMVENLSKGEKPFVMLFDEISSDALREAVNKGMEKFPAFAGLCENGESLRYIIGAKNKDMGSMAKTINSALNGKGGGRGEMISGTFSATYEEIKNYFEGMEF